MQGVVQDLCIRYNSFVCFSTCNITYSWGVLYPNDWWNLRWLYLVLNSIHLSRIIVSSSSKSYPAKGGVKILILNGLMKPFHSPILLRTVRISKVMRDIPTFKFSMKVFEVFTSVISINSGNGKREVVSYFSYKVCSWCWCNRWVTIGKSISWFAINCWKKVVLFA